ncbi:hypothetical protein EYF80_063149 [Liparis tanakae]|uniref:Uncharacterized protein n=1 Tax=Liparis tanakae TaxID=230148 RepID=A0A4Z2EDA5_9TELE|nr:hypothetical protein EYF80_063149 [Liparis tanakae]
MEWFFGDIQGPGYQLSGLVRFHLAVSAGRERFLITAAVPRCGPPVARPAAGDGGKWRRQ